MRQYNVWQQIYGDVLDFVITEIESDRLRYYKLENGFTSFCDRCLGFIRSCYEGDATSFAGNLARFLCRNVVQRGGVERVNVDDLIAVFIKIANDKRNFPKMLFKAMQRHLEMERAVQIMDDHRERENVDGTEEELGADPDAVDMALYEDVLAVIIVELDALELDGQQYRAERDATKQTQSAVAAVMRKCDGLGVDERSRSMIRQFFAGYLSPNEFALKDVCGLGPSLSTGCLVQ